VTDARVAKRYASALFNTALEQDVLQNVEDDLDGICVVISRSADLKRFLNNPTMTRESKLALMEKLFSDHVTALTMHAFRLLLKRRREDLINHVRMEYAELRRKHENVTYALVETCVKLGDQQRNAIIDKVSQASGKRVEAEFIVSADMIGGVRVTYDNFVLDGTARGYLNRMKNRILYDLLKQA